MLNAFSYNFVAFIFLLQSKTCENKPLIAPINSHYISKMAVNDVHNDVPGDRNILIFCGNKSN